MPYSSRAEQTAYQLRWITERRTAWVTANGPCVQCGSAEKLEVDHINPATKSMEPAAIWSRRLEVREAELEKCQVLCESCHAAKTGQEQKTVKHGTYAMRNQHGCRCKECLEYVRRQQRELRARKKAAAERAPDQRTC